MNRLADTLILHRKHLFCIVKLNRVLDDLTDGLVTSYSTIGTHSLENSDQARCLPKHCDENLYRYVLLRPVKFPAWLNNDCDSVDFSVTEIRSEH